MQGQAFKADHGAVPAEGETRMLDLGQPWSLRS